MPEVGAEPPASRPAPTPGIVHDEGFRRWCLVTKGWSRDTVEVRMRALTTARRRGLALAPFTQEAGEQYLADRLDAGATPDAYNGDVRLLNALAEYWHLPNVRFRRRRRGRSQKASLDAAQQRAVLAYKHPVPEVQRMRRALAHLALAVGARNSEVARMDLADVDPEQRTVRIRFPAKRGLRRVLPVEDWLWHPRRPFMAYLRWRLAQDTKDPALWIIEGGTRANKDYLRKCMREVGQQAGVRFNFTAARHVAARELRRVGNDGFIQFWLGHANRASAEPYLEDVDPEEARAAVTRRPRQDPIRRKPHGR
jgi:integrase